MLCYVMFSMPTLIGFRVWQTLFHL